MEELRMKKVLVIGAVTVALGLGVELIPATLNPQIAYAQKYSFKKNKVVISDINIKITKVSFYNGLTADDKKLIVFDYEITNKTNKQIDAIAGWQAVFKAYQSNPNTAGELTVGALSADTAEQILNDQTQIIKKGGTVHCRAAYELASDTKNVTLKAYKGDGGRYLGKHVYKIGTFQDQEFDAGVNWELVY